MADFMNDVIEGASLDPVESNTFHIRGSRGYKAALATRLALKAFIRECIDWSFNEVLTTANLAINTNTVTLPSTVNPNYIHEVWISGGALTVRKRLKMRTYRKYADTVLEISSTPTTAGEPIYIYFVDDVPYFHPYADAAYTVHFFGQAVPSEWNLEASSTTNLDVPAQTYDALYEMALWRFQRIERGGEYSETKYNVEDMTNKDSLLYKAIFANKLTRKKRLKRMKMGKVCKPYRYY